MDLVKYDGDIGTVDFLNLMMIDINGEIRNVSIPSGYISEKIFNKGIGFDASNYGFAKVTDSDMVAIPDMTTAFVEERESFDILNVLCDVKTTDGKLFEPYPRSIAQKAVEYLQKEGLADDIKMLVELEFHVFDEVECSTGSAHAKFSVSSEEGLGEMYAQEPVAGFQKRYHHTHPQDKYLDLRNEIVTQMESIGIAVKYHHHEVSVSQLEIELDFASLKKAADSVALSKWIIKNIADEMGLKVTFMPKPLYKLAGNGMHVHQFLEKKNKNIFAGKELMNLTKTGLNYISGLLDHSISGSLLAFTNPSTNSYKRLVPGYEAPVCATFAKGSRGSAIRIPGYLSKTETRMEYRTGDATSNIYYMLSAMLLAGIDGIKNSSDPIEKGYLSSSEKPGNEFPLDLKLVLDGLKKDNEYLLPVFSKELITQWIEIKQKDFEYVKNAPTPQEYELYF